MNLPELDVYDLTRLPDAISAAIADLDDLDRGWRVVWCQETGEHGVFVEPDPDGTLRFSWGGRPLFAMHRDAFIRYGATPPEMS